MTDRASAEELREAARAMWYAHTEDQRFAGPVSADPYRDFERALLAALRDTGPRPDSGIDGLRELIDADALAEAIHSFEHLDSEEVCDAPMYAAELARRYVKARTRRLSTPRTETSE